MRIGIDISQLAYPGGVPNYLRKLIESLAEIDKKNEYVLFFSSLRGKMPLLKVGENFKIKKFSIPQSILNILWNKLHIISIDRFIGKTDLFISSDWVEPPGSGKKAAMVFDLTVYKTPQETDKNVRETQKRKLSWVKKESSMILTISESSKNDIASILGIPENKIKVIYPGV